MVVTTKSTIVVNAAFLREIKDSNPEFYETIDRLRHVCETDDSPARLCRNLTRLLDQLREQLALQFSLEESYGYMVVPSHADGFLGEMAVEVQAHHGMLYMHLSDLAEQAEELQYRGVEPRQLRVLVESACEFEFRLREHERAENELIERSFRLF